MSADNRTTVAVAWISVVAALVTALGTITVAIIAKGGDAPSPPPDRAIVDITGGWHDSQGSQFDMVQTGSEYSFTAYGPNRSMGAVGWGSGTISNGSLSGEYTTTGANPNLSSGTIESKVSADGRQISGTMHDRLHGNVPGIIYRN